MNKYLFFALVACLIGLVASTGTCRRNASERDSLSASIEVRDTLVQVLHRVPRFKFLGIWFGTKGVRQEVVSKNPHTRITAAEYIDIKR